MSIEVLGDRRREREEKIHSFTTHELLCLLRLISCQPSQTRQRGGSYDGPYLYTTPSVSTVLPKDYKIVGYEETIFLVSLADNLLKF